MKKKISILLKIGLIIVILLAFIIPGIATTNSTFPPYNYNCPKTNDIPISIHKLISNILEVIAVAMAVLILFCLAINADVYCLISVNANNVTPIKICQY